jgi:hypothetical protein
MAPNPPPPFDADAAGRLCDGLKTWRFLTSEEIYPHLRAAVAEADAVDKVLPGRADHPLKPSLSEWVQAVVDLSVTLTRERDQLRERVKELERQMDVIAPID